LCWSRIDRKTGQLLLDEEPFLILGGEVGNSTASDPIQLTRAIDAAVEMHMNTVLAPVYWELIEPKQGVFDFESVETLIKLARSFNIRLVLLWFGTWKNSMSCYVPGWIKRDTAQFARVRTKDGTAQEILSPFCPNTLEADCRAFAELMKWLRAFDEAERTVIMVQVENEIGMIPEARDYSDLAETEWRQKVPPEVANLVLNSAHPLHDAWKLAGLKFSEDWKEVFNHPPLTELAEVWGVWCEELFMAYHYARFVEKVAQAGKAEYELPMFANAALIRPDYLPGKYPSAGPLPHLSKIWSEFAPSIDMISPDIYFPNFDEWCQNYLESGCDCFFVPEMAASARCGANIFSAIGNYKAIGTAPFAFEKLSAERRKDLGSIYEILESAKHLILETQQNGAIMTLQKEIDFDWRYDPEPLRREFQGIQFEVNFAILFSEDRSLGSILPTLGIGRWDAPDSTPLGAVMVIHLVDMEFLMIGKSATVTFHASDSRIGIESCRYGVFEDGKWITQGVFNGDQTHQGRHIHFDRDHWMIQRVRLYRYS
jgi:beta-galactosidase GanA